MRSRPQVAFLVAVGLALVALVVAGIANRSSEAFTLGVVPGGAVAPLGPGDRACQEGIDVPASFESVEVQVGTYRRPGMPLGVSVNRGTAEGARLGGGSVEAGYPNLSRPQIDVGRIGAGQRVAVCFENRGERKVALYGNAGRAAPSTTLQVRGDEVDADLTLLFHRSSDRSLLASLPDAFERAALFKAGWVGAWTFWLLAVAAVALVPLLLVRALRAAGDRSTS